MFRLPEIISFVLGRAELNVATNGALSDSCLVDVSRAWLRRIRRTLFISCWTKRCLYPLLMRCVVSALRRLLKKSSVEQILLSRNAILKGIDFLVWDGWQDDLRGY